MPTEAYQRRHAERRKVLNAKWCWANRDRRRATDKLRRAVAAGEVTRPGTCPKCGKVCVPIAVRDADLNLVGWLCQKCYWGERVGA